MTDGMLEKGRATGAAELEAAVVAAGSTDFAGSWRGEVYAGARQASSAARFGTLGIDFSVRCTAGA